MSLDEEQLRDAMRRHHAGAVPDAGFARRVVAALPAREHEELAFVARRLLPFATALALVLLLWAGLAGPAPVEQAVEQEAVETISPADDLLAWVLEEGAGS